LKRVILDESVPRQVGDHLPGYSVTTVPIEGWASVKNGKLLALIEEAGFNAFITGDKNLEAQQSLQGRPFAILLLSTNHWPSIRPHVSKISEVLHTCEPGSVTKVDCGAFTPRRMMKPKSPSP
jgi:hypothetical protein